MQNVHNCSRSSILFAHLSICLCTVSPAAILSDLACTNSSDKYQFGGGHSQVPPFCVRFCPSVSQGHTLAVADEEGVVSLFDTNRPSLAGL
eukprot:322523-Pleurochrysis_carterae.AAC.5